MFGFSISLLFISDEISEGLLIKFIDKKRAADNRNGCSKFEVIFPCDLGLYKAHTAQESCQTWEKEPNFCYA